MTGPAQRMQRLRGRSSFRAGVTVRSASQPELSFQPYQSATQAGLRQEHDPCGDCETAALRNPCECRQPLQRHRVSPQRGQAVPIRLRTGLRAADERTGGSLWRCLDAGVPVLRSTQRRRRLDQPATRPREWTGRGPGSFQSLALARLRREAAAASASPSEPALIERDVRPRRPPRSCRWSCVDAGGEGLGLAGWPCAGAGYRLSGHRPPQVAAAPPPSDGSRLAAAHRGTAKAGAVE